MLGLNISTAIRKIKSSEVPPEGLYPIVEFVLPKSSLAHTLFPLVISKSAPAIPSTSCQPKGEALLSDGL
jgi:hypothetical protein